MKKSLISIILAGALISFSGCGSDDSVAEAKPKSDIPFGDGSFSPFERVAIFSVVKDANGAIDYSATDAKVGQIATTIANYVATVNEPEVLGSDKFRGSNWIVAGVEGEVTDEKISHSILGIPTPQAINPNEPITATNTKKVKVVEICNKTYASKALGVLDVVEGQAVANGKIHGTALPCEIAVYSDDNNIYVDMLNPEAIFTLFFTDVLFGSQMSNEAFKAEMMELPTQVRSEIKTVIYSSLDSNAESYTKTAQKIGPVYESMSEVLGAVANSANKSPYLHYKYTKLSGEAFTSTEAKEIAQTLIETMTKHVDANAGVHEEALEVQLSEGSSWRSARETPLAVPGSVFVVEACSPYYAKKAMGTGAHHATALPCEISFHVDSDGSLMVSFLDPNFMFGAMFEDAISKMSAEELSAFQNLPKLVFGDLKTIVDYTFDNKLSITTSNPSQVTFNMTPSAE